MPRYIRIISLLIIALLFSACRFKSPTLAEQQELGNRGVLSSGSPAWAGRTAGANRGVFKNSGAIPEVFGTPVSVSSNRSANGLRDDVVASSALEIGNTEVESIAAAQVESSKVPVVKNSPLDRIAASCPGVDQSAQDTLLSTSLNSRISSYENLVKRCPSSKDLLTWLAKDYLQAGRAEAAESAVRRALVLDPNFSEAQGVLKNTLSVLGK